VLKPAIDEAGHIDNVVPVLRKGQSAGCLLQPAHGSPGAAGTAGTAGEAILGIACSRRASRVARRASWVADRELARIEQAFPAASPRILPQRHAK
jgi:hypothetical protein